MSATHTFPPRRSLAGLAEQGLRLSGQLPRVPNLAGVFFRADEWLAEADLPMRLQPVVQALAPARAAASARSHCHATSAINP